MTLVLYCTLTLLVSFLIYFVLPDKHLKRAWWLAYAAMLFMVFLIVAGGDLARLVPEPIRAAVDFLSQLAYTVFVKTWSFVTGVSDSLAQAEPFVLFEDGSGRLLGASFCLPWALCGSIKEVDEDECLDPAEHSLRARWIRFLVSRLPQRWVDIEADPEECVQQLRLRRIRTFGRFKIVLDYQVYRTWSVWGNHSPTTRFGPAFYDATWDQNGAIIYGAAFTLDVENTKTDRARHFHYIKETAGTGQTVTFMRYRREWIGFPF